MNILPRSFYNRDTVAVAADLLGALLVRRSSGIERVGRIVEVEAYLGGKDRASHSSRGMTARNKTMFGPPGMAYVYLVYGLHHCMNAVTEPQGHGAAVLLRALEPVRGVKERTRGPGLLCRAMDIDLGLNGCDLTGADFFIAPPDRPRGRIVRRPRIGVDYAGAWARRLLRFYEHGNPFVSRS